MKNNLKNDCNDCEFYNAMNGVCMKTDEYRHGYDDACDSFVLDSFVEEWENHKKDTCPFIEIN